MNSGFDQLDAAGFLEIWQHFDADGEDMFLYLLYIHRSYTGQELKYLLLFCTLRANEILTGS